MNNVTGESREEWAIWIPMPDFPDQLYFEEMVHSSTCITFKFSVEGGLYTPVTLTFSDALSYRYIDEGDMIKTLASVKGIAPWPIFTVKNSRYLAWFKDESCGIHTGAIFHFALCTPNEVFDVLSISPPTIDMQPQAVTMSSR